MEGRRRVGLTGDWDARISRRTLLRTGGSAAVGLFALAHAFPAQAAPPFTSDPFSLGVASGDPTPEGIVLWTRLAPAPLEGGGVNNEPYGVRYEVAIDPEFRQIVRRGAVDALPEEVHTVHAEITGLQPSTQYWYRFKFGTEISAVGQTWTAPAAGSSPAFFRFAFVSCQNYTNGYYPAYGDLAVQNDIELVVHLGDYIYEGPGGAKALPSRPHAPQAELLSLSDYRTRHAQYKMDPDLQAAHAAFPWLMTWDDHEFKDNYANLDLEPDQPLETVAERRAAAYLAYWEHSPLARSRKPVGKDMNLYRRAHWGDLATFHVLDTRQYRDDQMATQCTLAERDPVSGYCPVQLDPARSILGAEQRDWLFEGLLAAPASGWNVLANQVGFAPQDLNLADVTRRRFAADPWDGYVADRQRVLDFLKEHDLKNTVVITGDKHQNSVRKVAESYTDIAGPAITTEFVGTSISSEGDTPANTTYGGEPNNPHILFENFQRGYVSVEVDRDRKIWRSDFRVVETVQRRENVPAWTLASWIVEHGKPGAPRLRGEPSPAV
jgi:alkaline phosphatase D